MERATCTMSHMVEPVSYSSKNGINYTDDGANGGNP